MVKSTAKRRGLFITGTDTGVGKTFVAAGLACLLRSEGWDVGVMKPVASGCRESGTTLIPEDALLLKRGAGCDDPLDMISPICLRAPLAPHIAARLAGKPLKMEKVVSAILKAYHTLSDRHEIMIVEGVGGFAVPVCDRLLIGDIAAVLSLPVVIVAFDRLGMISHTLLTIEAIQKRELPIAGIYLNRPQPPDYAAATNREALERATDVPVFGPLPTLEPDNIEAMAEALRATDALKLVA